MRRPVRNIALVVVLLFCGVILSACRTATPPPTSQFQQDSTGLFLSVTKSFGVVHTCRSTKTAHHIALALALVIPIFLSLSYFFIGYLNLDATLRTEAEANALFASQIIHSNPDYWQFEQIRLQEFLSRRLIKTHDEIRRIVDLNNATVAEHRDQVAYPFMMRSHDLYDSGKVVAKLEITRSLRPLFWKTLLVGIFGYLLTIAIYWSVKTFILDSRQRAEEALLESEEKYRLLVSKLPAVVFKGYADWTVDFFDDKIEALTGYRKAEFDSRSLKWSEVILSEDFRALKTPSPKLSELISPTSGNIASREKTEKFSGSKKKGR